VTGEEDHDAAFCEFVEARYPGLVRFGFLLLGDRGRAEDLVQTSLLRTYNAWRRLREIAHADAYTRKVMMRLSMRWLQRRWRAETPAGLTAGGTVDDHAPSVDLAESMRQALLRLPVTQRAVVVLRFYEDRTEAQPAEVLSCSVGTVKSRTSRALASLRSSGLLGHEGDPRLAEVPRRG
jgi:RNA polymerase sigma-70 factor (sigma-E family)